MSSVLGSIFFLLSATIAAKVLGVVRSFWLARILNPADYGIWTFVLLISSYAPILSLGTGEALLKRVPFLLGSSDAESLREVEGGVLSFSILMAALCVPLIAVLPLVLSGPSTARFVLPSQLMFAAACVSFFSGFFTVRLQAYQRFAFLSAVNTARAATLLVLQIGFSLFFGLTGALCGFLLSETCVCLCAAFFNTKVPNSLSLRFSVPLYWRLIRIGLPITVVWWTYIIQASVDRVVSMTMLGDVQTGYYGIGVSIAVTFLMIPDSINQVLYPSVNETYGATRDRRDLIPLVIKPARIMSLVLPFFAFVSLLLLPLIFRYVVPKYLPGLQTTQILILGALFTGMMKGGANLLISIDRQRRLIVYIVGGIILNIAGDLALVSAGLGIVGIAVATAFSAVVLDIVAWWRVYLELGYSVRERVGLLRGLFWPAVLFTAFLAGVSWVTEIVGAGSLVASATAVGSFFLYWAVLSISRSYRRLARESLRAGLEALKRHPRTRAVAFPPGSE